MKFNFKIQKYQTDAVESVVRVFQGQPYSESIDYRKNSWEAGFRNAPVMLDADTLLSNIREVQQHNHLVRSDALAGGLGACSLDVEMETGTGKTYVYSKTMYELNQHYGWSKFIIVVPSIAIREGVKKSFEMTQDHFMEQYGKKVRFFVYNSRSLNQLEAFSENPGINAMIINMQAFNTSMKEGGKSREARIIYGKRDEFGSRRPMDVIRENNPILILDEPQKMGGDATQKALQNFQPLFCLNYSATHKAHHNLVYALDAVDAYNQKLVKKIEVKGFQIKNLRGTDQYLYLEEIILSAKHPPRAKLELEIARPKGINRELKLVGAGDNLYELSRNMEQYKGYRISEIDPVAGTVTFTNGETIRRGEVAGDISESEMRRIQIRETIKSHLDKEEELFNRGIKTLSLFFIDEVAKYRRYDEDGSEALGEYGRLFEQEYQDVINDYITIFDTPYQRYLKRIEAYATHTGYFSIDKKGHAVDSTVRRGADSSDDISAYDLILKNKERLLSFEEPTRFIFSHSALREGWDNPNVFQICTLKHSDNVTMKRQEVGRGMRLCVDRNGYRMDAQSLGSAMVHKVNKLTVIASESYKDFAAELQKQIKDTLYERPDAVWAADFDSKKILREMVSDGNRTRILNNGLNDNFYRKEFQTLWGYLNHKYAYTVSFDSGELIRKSIEAIDRKLFVSVLRYTASVSEQRDILSAEDVKAGDSFKRVKSGTNLLRSAGTNRIKYDLTGKIAEGAGLTRKTAAAILAGIRYDKFLMYRENPEEFIAKAARLIKEQKAAMTVEQISYEQIEGEYDNTIFTAEKHTALDGAFEAKKHIQDYVFTDSRAERRFVEELERAEEVCAYAKLPKAYVIPTPAGNYSPDWAIVFRGSAGSPLYFIAETKGTMESMENGPIEKARISCARKLFHEISAGNVIYHDVDSYQSMLDIITKISEENSL